MSVRKIGRICVIHRQIKRGIKRVEKNVIPLTQFLRMYVLYISFLLIVSIFDLLKSSIATKWMKRMVSFVIFDFLWHFHLISKGWNGSNYQNLFTTWESVLSTAAVIIVGCATAKVCNYFGFLYEKHLGHLAYTSAGGIFLCAPSWETP